MKITTSLLILSILCIGVSAYAQHDLQVDDGAGHYSIIVGSNPGTTFILPPGPGPFTLVTGTGTANSLTKWTGTNGIGNSLFTDNGSTIGLGPTTFTSLLHIATTTNLGLTVEGLDVIGGQYPVEFYGNTTGETFNVNTYGRILRLGDFRNGSFYDFGIDGNNSFFLMNRSSAVQALTLRNGNFGINETNPAALLSVGSGSPFQVNNSGAVTIGSGAPILKVVHAGVLYGAITVPAGGSFTNTMSGPGFAGLSVTDAVTISFNENTFSTGGCVWSGGVSNPGANQITFTIYNPTGAAVTATASMIVMATVIHQ